MAERHGQLTVKPSRTDSSLISYQDYGKGSAVTDDNVSKP